MNRRRTDTIGINLPDPFFDSYKEEVLVCCDIMNKIDVCPNKFISIWFDKQFLKKIVRSHILFIRDLELKGRTPIANGH